MFQTIHDILPELRANALSREVIRLMVDLVHLFDTDRASGEGVARTINDCCCGTGGMLTITKDRIQQINPQGFWCAGRNNTLDPANVTRLSAGETELSLVA